MDKLATLSKRLKEARDKFIDLKNCGIDEEILIVYLQHKTKMSRAKVVDFLNNVEDFYDKLVTEESVKTL